MLQQLSRAARICLIAVSIIGLSVSALAQTPAATPATPAAPAQPAGPAQPLSLEEAVKLALENNLDVRVERINPELQDLSIAQARTAWTPNLTATVRDGRTINPITSFFAGASDQLTRDSLTANIGANQLLPWGANYTVLWDTSRGKSNSVYDSPNPSLGSNLNFNFTQPLVRNREIDNARQQLIVTKMNRDISDVSLRQTVLATIRNVKYAYWNLKAAVAAQKVADQSLDLAKESLRNDRSRVEIGTMAPINVVESEAEVARRDEAAIVAESTVRRFEDALRTLILDPKSATFWAVKFDLTDQPTFAPKVVDVEAAVTTALEKRTDLRSARKNLELTEATIKFQRNQILPDVNAQVAYGLTGSGGTKLAYGSGGFPPPVIGQIDEGFGTVLSRLLSNDFRSWSFTINVSYPIGTSIAEATLARTKLQLSQSRIQMQNLELQVVSSVRDVARQVETNQKRVASTQATERLMQRRLEAEQKKYAAGMSTTFLVFQAQRDLADARYSALAALLDYNKSLVDLETVQEAPTAGGSSILVGGQ
ncbi:MAG: TolC family protein [Acidobacteria bacterium]|jgi:outer membrane protein TolC|nr:TolC family protein [Acidobacteriota bacterium]